MTAQQRIAFCTTGDGVRIAYARHGHGPPLVKAAHWMTHAEHDWGSPVWSHWLQALGERHSVVRYDARDTGLSDRNVSEVSLDGWVADLEAVVDQTQPDRFALLGMCQAGPVAIAYAARHPDRVSRLVLFGTYALGRFHRGQSERRQAEALITLMREQWDAENPAIRHLWASRFVPTATQEQREWFAELQDVSASAAGAARAMAVRYSLDVRAEARGLSVPTLVVHPRGDAVVPFEMGRQLATLIPGARFVPIESRNHLLLGKEPAWSAFLAAYDDFMAIDPGPGRTTDAALDTLTTREREVVSLVATGLTNDEIGGRLHLSPRTVERHLSNAYLKLGVGGRVGRAAAAARIASATVR